jgi:hypothetical protein
MRGIIGGTFDPETLVILETAFDEAWITLKTICCSPRTTGHGQGLA